MESEDRGAERRAGQECPALKVISSEEGKLPSEKLDAVASGEVTTEEREAIRKFLKEHGAQGATGGRASALARAALKLAGAFLVAGGVMVGYGDGNDGDDIG